MLSVPDGKEMGVAVLVPAVGLVLVLVLLLSASKILTFPAAPVGPELALPPQAVGPIASAEKPASQHKHWHAL